MFMAHLNDVGVYFDEHHIGHIKKSAGVAKAVNIPRGLKRSSQIKGAQFTVSLLHAVCVHTYHKLYLAIRIKGEVVHAVYVIGIEKRPLLEVLETRILTAVLLAVRLNQMGGVVSGDLEVSVVCYNLSPYSWYLLAFFLSPHSHPLWYMFF